MLVKNKQLCPVCNESNKKKITKKFSLNATTVTDSRVTKNGTMIRRRRLCTCGSEIRFTTYERIHRPELTVVKRNGQIIPFNRERIFQSVKIALNGCIDQESKTEQISNEVNEKIQDIGKESVPTNAQDTRWKCLKTLLVTKGDKVTMEQFRVVRENRTR